jgi:hypothetical protein
MQDLIQKLIDRQIFKTGTMVDAKIKKMQFGSPIILQKTLRVKEVHKNYCVADEEFEIEAETPFMKIKYNDILLVDGMDPNDLAAVYGLAPKTERFKRKKSDDLE